MLPILVLVLACLSLLTLCNSSNRENVFQNVPNTPITTADMKPAYSPKHLRARQAPEMRDRSSSGSKSDYNSRLKPAPKSKHASKLPPMECPTIQPTPEPMECPTIQPTPETMECPNPTFDHHFEYPSIGPTIDA
jgi:hypothetical protein